MLNRSEAPALIVAISTAGGELAALTGLLGNIPADGGMAFVLMQAPEVDAASGLYELIRRNITMDVSPAREGAALLANHVYILPQDSGLLVDNGCLRRGRALAAGWQMVDQFFASLAEDQGERAVCIMLDGAIDEGAPGLRVVKAHGGVAIALAEADGPRRAVMAEQSFQAGLLDVRLPVAEIPAFLFDYAQHVGEARLGGGKRAADNEMSDQFGEVLRHVQQRTGHDFGGYKSNTLLRRIQRRMGLLKIGKPSDYLARLADDPAESGLLFRDFLIGVTQFFRDPKAFGALRKQLGPLLEGCNAEIPFRVWVPGCATGEEVYSLAILLKEMIENSGSAAGLQIFGSDIDEAAIAVARAGRYHPGALAAVAPASRRRWFIERDGMMEPVRELRDVCVFSRHNVVTDPPFSRMHLISCRNLMIYFGVDLQEQVLQIFHYALRRDGMLFLGLSEGLGRSQKLFTVLDKRARIFRHSGLQAGPIFRPRDVNPAAPETIAHHSAQAREDWLARAVSRVMARHSPVHVIVDSQHEVVRFSGGSIADFLDPAPGFASLGLFSLLRPALQVPVRQALIQAGQTGQAVLQSAMLSEPETGWRDVMVIVEPLFPPGQSGLAVAGETPEAPFFIVAFSQSAPLVRADGPVVMGDPEQVRTRNAHNIAQVEALNEELRLTLDEQQAMNEELRSANEELEASREEMQSVNEELQTVNAELSSKNEKLVSLNNDFRNLLDSTHIATLFLDSGKLVKSFTPNIAELFALRRVDIGRPISDLNMRLDYPALDEDVGHVLTSMEMVEREVNSLGEPARVFIMRMRPYLRSDESVDGVVLTFVDITERKQAENQMWYQAHHDPLTGLPNRAMFHATMERGASGEADLPETLLLLDLDRFKTINDAFGHRVGDRLLQMVAGRLRGCVRVGDMVCRLGGDEFAITQTKAWNPERTIALADRILAEISLPYETDGYVMHIGVSIGIAFRADTAGDGEALIRAADTALYDAKDRAGNNWRIFYPGMQHRLKDRRDLEADLREAVAREELILMYQPLVRLADRRITGAEALLRWRHASRGLLAPADFISIAEETGLIVPIGNWVLNSACREAKSWAREIPVAVNLSPVQFGSPDLVAKLNEVLAATRLPARLLAVEMTESVLLQDNAQTRESLAALKSIGVAISMDDFGTGYSSLSYLRKFTIDKIKIDKAFTQAVDTEAESGVIVQAIVAIGKGLGIEICAEGAETEAQLSALARLGVTEVQGFALHPPMSAQDFAALVRRQV